MQSRPEKANMLTHATNIENSSAEPIAVAPSLHFRKAPERRWNDVFTCVARDLRPDLGISSAMPCARYAERAAVWLAATHVVEEAATHVRGHLTRAAVGRS